MKIMLVCMSGITTNVLANKLQAYGAAQGKKDYFLACKINVAEEVLPGTDMVLIAPQARFTAKNIRAAAARQEIPVCELSEEAFALSRLEEIYAQIEAARPSRPEAAEKEAGQKRLRAKTLWHIAQDALLSCVPFLALGVGARLWHHFTGGELSRAVWQSSMGIFSLYLLFAVGCQYGKHTQRPCLQCGAVALASPLLLLPMTGLESTWLGSVRIAVGTIPVSFFDLRYSPCLFALALLSVLLLDSLQRLHVKMKGGVLAVAENLVNTTLQGGCVFALFLLLRLILEYLA